jgi:hypothetical protein
MATETHIRQKGRAATHLTERITAQPVAKPQYLARSQ